MEACQIDSGLWHQSLQPGNEIQRLEDHMRGAIPVRRLELVANVAIRRERQSLLGYRRAADVAAQSLGTPRALATSRGGI